MKGASEKTCACAATLLSLPHLSSPFLSLPLELGNHLLGDAPQLAVEVICT